MSDCCTYLCYLANEEIKSGKIEDDFLKKNSYAHPILLYFLISNIKKIEF